MTTFFEYGKPKGRGPAVTKVASRDNTPIESLCTPDTGGTQAENKPIYPTSGRKFASYPCSGALERVMNSIRNGLAMRET
jgi:hypothetical protein